MSKDKVKTEFELFKEKLNHPFNTALSEEIKRTVLHNGKYYVFNPNVDKPRKVHSSYKDALEEAQRVADIANDEVLVLAIITAVRVKKETNIQDRTVSYTKDWETINLEEVYEDEWPF